MIKKVCTHVIQCFILISLSGCGYIQLAPVESKKIPKSPLPKIYTNGEAQEISQSANQEYQSTRQPNNLASERDISVIDTVKEVELAKKTGFHIIKKGETLYYIAWQYDMDYRLLSKWNKIVPPYTIYPKQVLRLRPRKGMRVDTKKTTAVPKPPPPQPSRDIKKTTWVWPTIGQLESKFGNAKKGIAISGKLGQTINAAAAGEVVYSGNGLPHYGQLIIIKHRKGYISAYAHNSELLVTEGDKVKANQIISKMGVAPGGQALLYFEIRENGNPIKPTLLLPKSRNQ